MPAPLRACMCVCERERERKKEFKVKSTKADTPRHFSTGMKLHLASLVSKESELLLSGDNIKGNVLADPSAKVSPGALVGPDVVIGPNCVIEDGARVVGATLLGGKKARL